MHHTMSKYFLYSHLKNSYNSFRKATREHLYMSFNRVYILSLALFIILWVLYVLTINLSANSWYKINTVEKTRREKNQEMLFLRSQIARQISSTEIQAFEENVVKIWSWDISYATIE